LKEGTQYIHTHQMETIDPLDAQFCDTLTDEQDEFARELVERVAGKWPLWVMHVLAVAPEPVRFTRLRERVDGISQKVLTQTLRALERDGLVLRTLYPQVPPRVEYCLTPMGRELLLQVLPIWRWVAGRIGDFETARAHFDEI